MDLNPVYYMAQNIRPLARTLKILAFLSQGQNTKHGIAGDRF